MKNEYLRCKSEEMLIAKKLVKMGIEQKRARIGYHGWVCGTYTSSLRRTLAEDLHAKFDKSALRLICQKWKLYDNNEMPKEEELTNIDFEKIEGDILSLIPDVRINQGGLMDMLD